MDESGTDLDGSQHEFLTRVLKGNEAAVMLCESYLFIAHVWDDLHDGDYDRVPKATLDRAFWMALIGIPNNPFYIQNASALQPVLQAAIMDWHASTDFEALQSEALHGLAFVIRAQVVQLISQCALLVGGYDYARTAIPLIRAHFHKGESLPVYLDEMKARDARQVTKG